MTNDYDTSYYYFNLTPTAYLRLLAWRCMWRIAIPAVAVLAATAAAAFADMRFAIVALIEIFIVFPSVMTYVSLRYALSERGIRATRPRRFSVGTDSFTISYRPEPYAIADETFAAADFKSVDDHGKITVLALRDGRVDSIVPVPTDIFGTFFAAIENYNGNNTAR